MAPDNSELERFLQHVLSQPTFEEAARVLTQNPGQINRELLDALGWIAARALASGDPNGARSVFGLGLRAAGQIGNDAYVVTFTKELARTAQSEGNTQLALELYTRAWEDARGLAARRDKVVFEDLIEISNQLAQLLLAQDNQDLALKMLSDARRTFYEENYPTGQVWTDLNLAVLSVRALDLDAAQDYVTLATQQFLRLDTSEPEGSLPPASAFYQVLIAVCNALFYQRDAFQEVETLAQLAIQLNPQETEGYFFLGNSQLHLGEFQEAAHTWKQAVTIKPDWPSAHWNYAITLSRLNQLEQALQAMETAIRFRPDDIRLYRARAEMNQAAGRHPQALLDLEKALALVDKLTDTEDAGSPPPRSIFEAARQMQPRAWVLLLRKMRYASYVALNDIGSALEEADYLLQTHESEFQFAGRMLRGALLASQGERQKAIAEYSAAVELLPGNPEPRRARLDLYLEGEQWQPAVQDIAVLAQDNNNLEFVIDNLNTILERSPQFAEAYKWRGFAYDRMLEPRKAIQDLDRALEYMPEDPTLMLRRALVLIKYNPADDDWNQSIDLKRIMESIEILASLIRQTPQNTEALHSLKWIIDRIAGYPTLFAYLLYPQIREALPTLESAIQHSMHGLFLTRQGDWIESNVKLRAAQTEFLELGFPVLATRLHLYIADNYLRLYEFQACLDHLKEAEKLPLVVWQPMSHNLQSLAENISQSQRLKSGKESANIELEYSIICSFGFMEFSRFLKILQAEALARLGNIDKALSVIGDVEEYFSSDPQGDLYSRFGVMLSFAIILRDAGEIENARSILERLDKLPGDQYDRVHLYNTWGTIYMLTGDLEPAQQYFTRAHDLAEQLDNRYLSFFTTLNLASNLYARGRIRETLEMLDRLDISGDDAPRQRNSYLELRAMVLLRLGRGTDAQKAYEESISIVEDLRSDLKSYSDKMSWQAKNEDRYELGALIALDNSDLCASLDLVEKSKSRAFMDQLKTGHIPLPEADQALEDIHENLSRKRNLLLRLSDSIKIAGPTIMDYDALGELGTLTETIDLLEQQPDGTRRLSISKIDQELADVEDTLVRVRHQIEDARLASIQETSVPVLTLRELRAIMKV